MRIRPVVPAALVFVAALATAAPASADITAFLGLAGGPSTRGAWGLSGGAGFLVVAFEFEYASVGEASDHSAPRLSTGMFNVLFQTPVAVAGAQLYATAGAGPYHENLGSLSETNVGYNLGGGAKIGLIGPLRLRVDYRFFKLSGSPFGTDTVHRFYVGANLRF